MTYSDNHNSILQNLYVESMLLDLCDLCIRILAPGRWSAFANATLDFPALSVLKLQFHNADAALLMAESNGPVLQMLQDTGKLECTNRLRGWDDWNTVLRVTVCVSDLSSNTCFC